MRKIVLGLTVATLFLSSCSKDDKKSNNNTGTPPPTAKGEAGKSFIKLTLDKKLDLEVKDTIITYPGASAQLFPFYCKFEVGPHVWGNNLYDKTISINTLSGDKFNNGRLKLVLAATSFGSPSNSLVDEYKTVSTSETAYYIEDQLGEEPFKKYKIKSQSRIMVSVADNDHTEGKLELYLVDPGGEEDIRATGEFKIYYHL